MNWIMEAIFGEVKMPEYEVPKPPGRPSVKEYGQSVSVKDFREERPKFAREYSRILKDGIRCQIRYRTSYGLGRYPTGELTQANGRWVLFDPERIAEKILDPLLIPYVEEFALYAKHLDRIFMESNPSRFVDESGQTWEKVR